MALAMPALARDGVTFCWYARELGARGVEYLRSADAVQHPLYPAAILGVQRVALSLGAPDLPTTWQRAGQVVSLACGMAVVALSGLMARRLARALQLPLNADSCGLLGAGLAAIVPLNVALSADVMSDELHLALYLATLTLALAPLRLLPALLAGACGGLAFLTRPEGLVAPLAVITAILAPLVWRRSGGARGASVPARSRATAVVAVCAGVLVCAAPYWLLTGRLSPKKDPIEWLRHELFSGRPAESGERLGVLDGGRGEQNAGPAAGLDGSRISLAKLTSRDFAWWQIVPEVLHQTLRCGRVVLPLLALAPLLALRRRLLADPLLPLSAAFAAHFGLLALLVGRAGYLDPRHTLVLIALLTPLAAMQLARIVALAIAARRLAARVALHGLAGGLVLPLALYSLRVPNAADAYLPAAAGRLRAEYPDIAGQTLLCGSGPKRIAFYAGMRWLSWPEQPEHFKSLRRQILDNRVDWFAIVTGGGDETAGNDEALRQVLDDVQLRPHIRSIQREPATKQGTLHLVRWRWSNSPAATSRAADSPEP